MNPKSSPAMAAALLALLAAAGCGSADSPTGAAAHHRAEPLQVQAALAFGGPFRWKEQEKAFEVAGAPGPMGLDRPLRPLATLFLPSCPARKTKPYTTTSDRISAQANCEAKVRFGIAADGRVNHTQLLHAAQSAGVEPSFNFGFNVVTNVNQWRFEPPMRGGKPADICCVELTLD